MVYAHNFVLVVLVPSLNLASDRSAAIGDSEGKPEIYPSIGFSRAFQNMI